jgi:sulfur-carrier protein adenylyltransferase/sulfurtransferase
LAKTYEDFVREARSRIREIGVLAARERYDADDGCIFLDVREQDEVEGGTVPGAVWIPRGLLEGHVGDMIPDRDYELIVVCARGNRSALAADTLRQMGFSRVSSLAGGMVAWHAARQPMGSPRVL